MSYTLRQIAGLDQKKVLCILKTYSYFTVSFKYD